MFYVLWTLNVFRLWNKWMGWVSATEVPLLSTPYQWLKSPFSKRFVSRLFGDTITNSLPGDQEEPGGEQEWSGDPAERPELSALLSEKFWGAQPAAQSAQGCLCNGLQCPLQNPGNPPIVWLPHHSICSNLGNSLADSVGGPSTEHDCPVAIWDGQDCCICACNALQGQHRP